MSLSPRTPTSGRARRSGQVCKALGIFFIVGTLQEYATTSVRLSVMYIAIMHLITYICYLYLLSLHPRILLKEKRPCEIIN